VVTSRLVSAFSPGGTAWLILTTLAALFAPLALTLLAWRMSSNNVAAHNRAAFEVLAMESETALRHRLDSYENALLGANAHFLGTDFVSSRQWRTYVRTLDIHRNFPGMDALGYIESVPESGLEEFTARVRKDDQPGFTVRGITRQSPDPVRPPYYIVTYFEPAELSQRALGFNLGAEPERLRAAETARDTGEPALTGRVELTRDGQLTPGFWLLHPLYWPGLPLDNREERRQGLRGWIFAPIVAKNFLHALTPEQGALLNLQVYDGAEAQPDQLIYGDGMISGGAPQYVVTRRLDFMHRRWLVQWKSTPDFEAAHRDLEPIVVLAGGLLLSVLLAVVSLLLALRRQRTMEWVTRDKGYMVPAAAFAVLAGGTLLLYQQLKVSESREVASVVTDRAAYLRKLIEAETQSKLKSLQRLAQRWDAANGTPEAQWRQDAANHITQLGGVQQLAWIDTTCHQRWSEPVDPASADFFDADCPEVLRNLSTLGAIFVVDPRPVAGQPVLIKAYTTVQRNNMPDGFMRVTFNAAELFDAALTARVVSNFDVRILGARGILFHNRALADAPSSQLTQLGLIQVYDRKWQFRVTPTPEFLVRHHSWLPTALLAAGLLLSVLVSLVVRAVLVAKLRAAWLANSSGLNDAILSSAATLVVATDLDGKVMLFNKAAEKALGYSAAEVIGRCTPALWHDREEMAARARKLSAELGRTVEPRLDVFFMKGRDQDVESNECTFVRKDGSRFDVSLTLTTLRGAAGEVVGYLAMSEDITARKQAERQRDLALEGLRISEERHRLLIDGVADYAIYWLDVDGRVNSWNAGAQNLKQYTAAEIIGKHFSVFFTEEDRQKGMPARAIHEARTRGKFEDEGWRVRKDGTRFWASVLLEPIRAADGGIVGFAKVSHDVSLRREADRRLADTLRELDAVLNTMADGLITIDDQLIIRSFTPSAERIFGYRAAEVVGRPVSLLIPDQGNLAPEEWQLASGGREVIARRKDGSQFPMELGISPYEIDGRRRYVGVVRDITERRTAELAIRKSGETFRAAMGAASIGMALVKPDGRFMEVNDALCTLLGYEAQDLLANDFQSITHVEDLERDLGMVRQALSGQIQSYRLEKRYYHKSGRVIWALLSVSLVRDVNGDPDYFVSQIQDITDQREAERIKSEFISVVSHELRTPLTSIRGSLGLILGAFATSIPEKAARLVRIAHQNCERLIPLINDILDIDKIASGKMRFEMQELPLAQVMQRVVEATEPFAQKYEAQLELLPLPSDVRIAVDEDRFVQAMGNLISNACKFSPKRGKVVISATVAHGRVHLSVTDSGPGIPEEFRGRIFERFSQADSSAVRQAGGTGLGLHITRQIVERMNGYIGFDTQVGRGSTFWLEFPIVAAASKADIAGAAVLDPSHRGNLPRILHVEDDVDLGKVLAASLQGRAHIELATSLHQAEQLLCQGRYAMVVLDIDLPDGSGLDLLDRLESLTGAAVPVVILCAEAPPPEVHGRVATVMVKTRLSEAKVVETIVELLERGQETVDV
jgi:PAS domain S-box-containing protein